MLYLTQCYGAASIIMRIGIRDPKDVLMDPDTDPRGVKTKEEKYTKQFSTLSLKMTLKNIKN